jgi:hypothetical protein
VDEPRISGSRELRRKMEVSHLCFLKSSIFICKSEVYCALSVVHYFLLMEAEF